MSIEEMRVYLENLDYGPSWLAAVKKMPDRQVAAIYLRTINQKEAKKW